MNGFDREKNEITKCPPRTTKEYRLNKLEVCTQSKGNLPLLEFILAYPESNSAINLPAKIRKTYEERHKFDNIILYPDNI